MGDEKVSEYEQISESDQADVAADEVVKDWPDDVELGAVDPTRSDDLDGDDEEDDKTHQETPPDDGDKTSAVVFEDDEDDEDVEEL